MIAALDTLQNPAGFLALLWTDADFDGWLTFFTKTPGGKTVTAAFHRSRLADAEKWALTQAKTANIWHGVCLRKEKPAQNKRGEAKDVIALPGLWLDLDVRGPGHAEKNLPISFEQALDFIKTLPLKPSLIVFTGGGLQPYWLFPEPMRLSTEAEWTRAKNLSERWQRFIIAMGKERGWKLDNTSDLPRVLRLPGTWNRKTDQPVLVTVPAEHVDLAARYDLAAVEAVLPSVETPPDEPDHAEAHDDVADADIKLIVGKCAWARHCRDDAAGLPEPEWYAAMSIWVRCKDGTRLAHDWSKAHPKYSLAETDAKLKQAMSKAGPRTCESIKADFGTHCNGCAARVKSPIVLGRLDRLPEGFQARDTGIFYRVEDNDGNTDWVRVCSPIKVLALTREGDDLEWGRLVEVRDPDGNAHRWAMPMRALRGSGDDLRGELLAMGLDIAPGKGRARLHDFLSLCRPRGRARCVSRIGWHGRRFILPDAVFGLEAGESVILQAERVDNPFKVQGALAEWQDSLGRFCVGNSRLVLSVSAALAAPLLYLACAESGGLHLVGGSSLGKTTALVVAGSVCGGGGVRGYVLQWRATANGLEGVAAGRSDALLCLDELSQVTPQAAGETAYMLTNETGKTRATKQGTARKPAEWRILFLSTGEITLADKIREDGKSRAMAGQLVRVVDIYADAGVGLGIFEDLHGFHDGDAFSRHLKEAAKLTYGVALRAFLEKVTAGYDEAMRVVPALIKSFMTEHCPAGADGQVKRVCNRFALVAAGGECGAAYGVLPWPKGEATRAAARCFQDWLVLRGGTGASEIQAALAQVRAFFQAHGSSRFEVWGDRADETKTINRAGFRRKEDATGAWEYYVPPAAFKSEIARGHDTKRLVKDLVERGLIVPGKDGKPASLHKIPGQPQAAKYYRFAPEVVLDDQADETRQGLTKNRVTTVTRVTEPESQVFPGNPTENQRVTRVTAPDASAEPEAGNPLSVTQVTQPQNGGLPKKDSNIEVVTRVTQLTAENDNSEQKTVPVIDMKPAEGTGLWTGPAEVEI
ncbi:MAG: DUF927 domain-containing protein [Solidesulfovibrio sp.]|uniref:DUF927 domain-containing protein n=1 Tax=Solidesulfovibrio sp. TaxID=2910990 RepID=UPI002B1F90C7|nr:DUF927 domain-containing protein [Solidesulfovibrio sp.]MEA4858325.1 DUF927 domain-containing protein [Solidesulfovibrio sp.]